LTGIRNQIIEIMIDNKNYIENASINNKKNKDVVFILSNDGVGAALNIDCNLKGKEISRKENYGVSLTTREKCLIYFQLLSDSYIQEEHIEFIFEYCDIFQNKYQQIINIRIVPKDNFNQTFLIDSIGEPFYM
jgi:hypothetical protein